MIKIAKRIDDTIEDDIYSVNEVAEKIGITRQQLARWRKGTSEPTALNLKKFCLLYNISADYILGIERGKRKDIRHCTKYTFLYSYLPKSQATLTGGFFSLHSAPHGALPKNVIETRYRPLRGLGL